ncbi:MAG: 30S ribosomal protein S4 [Chitinophagales bacterium]|nr:30S ribosomal protein S4 [Chitinophagales bacterium]HAE13713.1 30S ribosomal protein S4 [Bacteroidota bacterium]MCB9022059.1 30S ribosomal protein S4 [Chitinophagales bacterium]MCB9031788.1 30S ribosomal protein S4 [Chitinophagales bacterium]HPE96636.1 30S ribosomal protein S4 [Chitinophagales bacterium]
MARYTGPTSKKARSFGEPIFGFDKAFEKRKYPPGQHGVSKRRKSPSEYGVQLKEKQKAKYTYGVLERQFAKTYEEATKRHGVTGEVLLQLLEARLDNTIYRMGLAPTRRAARQMVNHKHIEVNGMVSSTPSHSLRPGDVITVRERSKDMKIIREANPDSRKYNWLEWNPEQQRGVFLQYPERDQIPETIKEQLIVELYSK